MNVLYCALDKKEFHRVFSCESAYEIQKKLEVVYERTNQVKECKISRFTRQYKMFEMESYESVHDMYTRCKVQFSHLNIVEFILSEQAPLSIKIILIIFNT